MKRRIRHRFAEALTPWGRRSFYSDVLAQSPRLIVLSGGSPQYVSAVLLHLLSESPLDNFDAYHALWSPMEIVGVFCHERRVNIIPSAIIDQDTMGSLPATVQPVHLKGPHTAWPRVSHRTSRLLAIAKYAHDEMEARIKPHIITAEVDSVRQLLLRLVPLQSSTGSKGGKIRHFFGGSLTPTGWVDFLPEEFNDLEVRISFQGTFGLDHTSLIRWFGERISFVGYDVDFYHCEWDSSHVDHIVAPSLKLGVTLATAPHALEPRSSDISIDMRHWLSPHHEDLLPLINTFQTGINQTLNRLYEETASLVNSTDLQGIDQDVALLRKVLNESLILS